MRTRIIHKHHHSLTPELVVLVAAAVGGIFLGYYYRHLTIPNKIRVYTLPALPSLTTPTPTPIPQPQTKSVLSPDGTRQVVMTVVSEKDDNKTYLFAITNPDGSNSQSIYSITLPPTESMSIPYNTFSPDDRYIFLEHMASNGTIEAWVFRTDGTSMSATQPYDNATAIFSTKISSTLKQATTGWASDTLLIIDTYSANDTEGTSYWLEVPSTAIIPLATQF